MSGRGSRPGEHRGGRKKGVKNKATIERERANAALLEQAKSAGISPLEVMLGHMREQHALALAATEPGARQRHMAAATMAAKDAAPYIHPRLNAVDHSASGAKNWRDVFRLVDALVAAPAGQADGA